MRKYCVRVNIAAKNYLKLDAYCVRQNFIYVKITYTPQNIIPY